MKFSTEAIVASAIAVVFAVFSLGAIAREQGERAPGRSDGYVVTTPGLSQVAAGESDVSDVY
jgi:hypothetical protein